MRGVHCICMNVLLLNECQLTKRTDSISFRALNKVNVGAISLTLSSPTNILKNKLITKRYCVRSAFSIQLITYSKRTSSTKD